MTHLLSPPDMHHSKTLPSGGSIPNQADLNSLGSRGGVLTQDEPNRLKLTKAGPGQPTHVSPAPSLVLEH